MAFEAETAAIVTVERAGPRGVVVEGAAIRPAPELDGKTVAQHLVDRVILVEVVEIDLRHCRLSNLRLTLQKLSRLREGAGRGCGLRG
jgi:hypothetical protein